MFLGFANFYRRFIKNFSKITVLLYSLLRTIDNNKLDTQFNRNQKNHKILSSISDDARGDGISKNIKNLSTIAKSAKFKKSNLAKSKKPILLKDFIKAIFGTDFLTTKAKNTFIYF